MFVAGGAGEAGQNATGQGMIGLLINLLVAEKSGFQLSDAEGMATLRDFADRMTNDTLASMQQPEALTPPPTLEANGKGA